MSKVWIVSKQELKDFKCWERPDQIDAEEDEFVYSAIVNESDTLQLIQKPIRDPSVPDLNVEVTDGAVVKLSQGIESQPTKHKKPGRPRKFKSR